MITISAFNDRDEALISKALLEAAGVPVTLREEKERLYILVRETDARQAHAVLSGPDPRTPRSRPRFYIVRLQQKGSGLLGTFVKGGFLFTAGAVTFCLLLLLLGIEVKVSPFTLVLLFFLGACGNLVRNTVRIREKVSVYRRQL